MDYGTSISHHDHESAYGMHPSIPSTGEPSPRNKGYQVWCDVGGTFTDCFVADPSGAVWSTKVLSHGRMPGIVEAWLDERTWVDASRRGDPPDFWSGCPVAWLDQSGKRIGHSMCIASDPALGSFAVASPPCTTAGESIADSIASFELDPGLEAPVLAARLLLRIPLGHPLPPLNVRLGTTRGTNALLTRTGTPTVLLITRGFADLLDIGYQERPELFAIRVQKRSSLAHSIVEVTERLAADGHVLTPLDVESARSQLQALKNQGFRSIAICLLHAYLNPTHEHQLEQLAKELGFECVCCSSRVAPVIKAVSRAETTLVDAYLTPVVRDYLDRVQREFSTDAPTRLHVMTSSGGLVEASQARGRHTVLSGPAGGAVALQAISSHLGIPRLIGLDMGGTSTDVCRIEGRLQLEHETIKAGVRMVIPTLAIHTVASGGGSICWFDGVQLRVGPQSAGSDPGPACYGRGGPLTITDLNLLHGRIDPSQFPIPLDPDSAKKRVHELLERVHANPLFQWMHVDDLIDGLRRLANEQMASAVRSISIEQGADPREHVLSGFGGAAGQHICEIAELLGMPEILDHPDAGLLSALGMGLASIKRARSHPLYTPWRLVILSDLKNVRLHLEQNVALELETEGVSQSAMTLWCELEIRYEGTEGSLRVPWTSGASLESLSIAFEERHKKRFGYLRQGRGLELVGLWVEASSSESPWHARASINPLRKALPTEASKSHAIFSRGRWTKASRWSSEMLMTGTTIAGPALIQSTGSTTIIESGWAGRLRDDGIWILRRSEPAANATAEFTEPSSLADVDPVLRDVLAQRIAAIADQMGIVLEQTAISVNVKQRRDFSCAVFDRSGELIANAPHVPVHLGAMSRTVQAILREFPQMQPGDCLVTNDPYRGGSHLPDVTVITPVFARAPASSITATQSTQPDFFVASRAHHAEIGGIAPGSMAPTSTRLGEEGVILPPMHLLRAGSDESHLVEALLRQGPFPSRCVSENMADLAAQQAANMRGATAMQELALAIGCDRLCKYLDAILDAAESKTRQWIATLSDQPYHHRDFMDDGTPIEVTLRKCHQGTLPSLRIDFQGTGPTSQGNLNANPGIVTAAVLYGIRCAIADTMPLNSGVLRAVELHIPDGILNPPCFGPQSEWPAVAGGNVETSQRIVDCLLGALGLAAASQGTMNNFLFGNATFGYYETIGGGTGASPLGPGADAVHSHMTNTRLTDVEVLESRYPVRLAQFAIRRGSGGNGLYPGGDGMVREIEALENLEVSLVTSRRGSSVPFGLEGGDPGASGENWLIDRNGNATRLPSACQLSIRTGDRVRILTPGGGGFGSPPSTLP